MIPTIVLNNNTKIPALGMAAYGGDTEYGSIGRAVKEAIDLGIRYIDTSPMNEFEQEVGEAISAKIKEGVVKREELYLVGKLLDTKAFHKPDLIKASLMSTLRNLNVAYIDMYVINCPEGNVFATEAFVDTWNELEKLVDLYLVKSIGLANFNVDQIKHLMNSARVTPVASHVECHPQCTQRSLKEYCKQKRIVVVAHNIYGLPSLADNALILDLAKKYKRTPEQILIRYHIDKGHVAIPEASYTVRQMKDNLEAFAFELNAIDIASMDKMDRTKYI